MPEAGAPEVELKEFRYDFGNLPKFEARNMWRCDVLTGELKKVTLEKEHRRVMKPLDPKKPTQKIRDQIVNLYWIMTKSKYFYLPAKTIEEAKEKFEAEFARVEAEADKRNKAGEPCLKKV